MLQVGDIVKVVDIGKYYPQFSDFFKKHKIKQFLKYWKPNNSPNEQQSYEIQFIGSDTYHIIDIAVIATLDYTEVFLISIEGIEKVKE